MALTPGTRLGSYEIVSALGAGGMGEVYRATDAKLKRQVAVKILPPSLAADFDRVARFQREAEVLASLNHPHIATVYGFEESGDLRALVMELVEGEDLSLRITRGAIPIDDALPIAKQIAQALEAAHEQGIIHRDLKPANIKVRPDGTVKVLDFGLAKLVAPRASGVGSPQPKSAEPTTVVHAGTIPGLILGTAAYMSPEQARGEALDKRTDIWAFAVVLWEMLTGTRLFSGRTLSDTIASVLNTEPDWTMLPSATPESVKRLLRRSLQKDQRLRLDSATVARLEIDDALTAADAPVRHQAWPALTPWVIVAVVAIAMVLVINAWPNRTVTDESPTPIRLTAEAGADILLRQDLGASAILSPDGQTVILASDPTTGPSMLYVRRLDQLRATPLLGTEGATNPFFSPDGAWVGFFTNRTLKRISVAGGAALAVTDVTAGGSGGSWAEDGSIVFGSQLRSGSVLRRVPSTGGNSEPMTSLREGELAHRWPQTLPDGRGVLYSSASSNNWEEARVMVVTLPSGETKVVQPGFYGRYVPTGHLLYVKGGTVHAAPFDLERLEVSGPSVAVVEDVVADTSTGGAQFATSQTGTLVFVQGRGYSRVAPMAWMDRGGNTVVLRSTLKDWSNPRVSPDGNYLAYDIHDGKQINVWVYDISTGKNAPLTFGSGDNSKPVWTPDGKGIVFASTRGGPANLYWQRADGTGDVVRLTESQNAQVPTSWHPNGKFLAFTEINPHTGRDVMMLPIEQTGAANWRAGTPRAFNVTPENEGEATFSPDGRWVAYHGNETGRVQVFVKSFEGNGKWQISSAGGRDATWSRARPELLYFDVTANQIMVTPFAVDSVSFRSDVPRRWSNTTVGRPNRGGERIFDLHPDGERAVVVPAEKDRADHLTFVFNFFEQLRRPRPRAQ